MPLIRQAGRTGFVQLPEGEILGLAWPTPNHQLFSRPEAFFARTRANPLYGHPGWTRECGKRFHRGCDVAPVNPTLTGRSTRVLFTDCATGSEYASEEPVWSADDPVAAVLAGRAAEVNLFEEGSDFGLFTVLRHAWPGTGRPFYTLYAHLSDVRVRVGEEVQTGSPLGRMGQTSRNADARNWMAIAPHLHFEVWNEAGESHDPAEFLSRWLPRH